MYFKIIPNKYGVSKDLTYYKGSEEDLDLKVASLGFYNSFYSFKEAEKALKKLELENLGDFVIISKDV